MMIITSLNSFAQVKMPAPSPTQTIKQDFGLGNIEIIYSRPSAKGRTVFGDLVPNGKIWRTGANEATKIKFSDAVEIGGKKIDSGTYVLYSLPNEESWEIILNKGITNWGVDGYNENKDVIRFKIVPEKSKSNIETFTMQFEDIKAESCRLQLSWGNKIISIPIVTDIKSKIKAQIDAAMQSDKKPFWQAAQYYYEYEKNLPKALDNAGKAAAENPKAYWIFLYKARIQKDLGDIKGALATSGISLDLAKEAGNEDYVSMNKKLQKELKRENNKAN